MIYVSYPTCTGYIARETIGWNKKVTLLGQGLETELLIGAVLVTPVLFLSFFFKLFNEMLTCVPSLLNLVTNLVCVV